MAVDLESLLAMRPPEPGAAGRLRLGQVVGDWRIEAFLGAGRSSEVYRVMGTRWGGEGALKLLVDESHGLRARFDRECDVLRSLSIPSLPRFFASGELNGRPYYVMEYLQPLFLPLDRSEVVPFMQTLARDVQALHDAGYVHRDLKPANILRRRDGSPVLIDLGLVRRVGEKGKDGVGTRGYAAPEQLIYGESTVRADVFSLGKILRTAGGSALSRRLAAVARKAASEDPAERYPSAAAFADELGKSSSSLCVAIGAAVAVLGALAALLFLRPSSSEPTDAPVRSVASALPVEDDASGLVRRAEDRYYGNGCTRDRAAAFALYRQAAELGHLGAQDTLGACLLRGDGCEADPVAAVRWFKAAAERDHPSAMNNLAFCYMNGKGVPKDEVRGFVWAEMAAQTGHAPSQRMVAECYLTGRGVERNDERARGWLERAAAKGDGRAKLLLRSMQQSLP